VGLSKSGSGAHRGREVRARRGRGSDLWGSKGGEERRRGSHRVRVGRERRGQCGVGGRAGGGHGREDGSDGGGAGRLTGEDEKGVATRVDLELVPLTEDIGDMILSLGGLPLGPDVLARELVALGLAGVRESPDDRGSSVLDVRAGRSLGEL
jgi:hypothetical protein